MMWLAVGLLQKVLEVSLLVRYIRCRSTICNRRISLLQDCKVSHGMNLKTSNLVTVCDAAAGETCPLWFGHSVKVHWGLADPSKIEGSEAEIAQGFHACIAEITKRVNKLVPIAEKNLTATELKSELAKLAAH